MLDGEFLQIGEVAQIAGVEVGQVRNWMARGFIPNRMGCVRGGGGPGKPLKFTARGAMLIVTGAALVRAGASPEPALTAAAGMAFENQELSPSMYRFAGLPFPWTEGETYLVLSGERSWVIPGDSLPRVDILLGDDVAFCAANVSAVFRRLCAHLGHDAAAVLEAVYGREALDALAARAAEAGT